MQRNVGYTLLFAAAVCVVCAVVVSTSAVSLKERQTVNAALDKQKNVLIAAGLASEDETLTAEEIEARFGPIEAVVVELETGREVDDVDPATYDQRKATTDPARSQPAPDNLAQVQRVPNHALVYKVKDDSGATEMYIFPVEGKGLWSTLYGFLAVSPSFDTVRGITFYEHKETPGLGGEVDNPRWKSLWPGRKIFGPDGDVELEVVKGQAGPPEEAPYKVDGLSGATITSRGVTYLIRFWLGENGFGPYLDTVRSQTASNRQLANHEVS